jgi:pyridoxamine 5'-phosphate oxidase
MTEIVYPIWRQRLARSLHINRSQVHSKYYQVASVCPSGRPKNRTMVFRGFLMGTQNLLSVTDLRSEKVSEWQGEEKLHFEICWYFTGSREQYRVAGEVALISNVLESSYRDLDLGELTKTSLIKQQWSNLSSNAKEPFYSSSPKAPFDDNSTLLTPQEEPITSANDVNMQSSDNFCVIVFIPLTVDYLNLKSKPQQRCLYDIQDGWKEQEVNP